MSEHTEAIDGRYDAAVAALTAAADAVRASIDGDIAALRALGQPPERPPLIPDVPVDEPPPYIPPPSTPSARALIPDTPLVESPAASAFDDDAPLWQS